MATDDVQEFRKGLTQERENLTESDDVTEADKEAIRRWLRHRDGELAVSSLKTYLRRLRVAAERSAVPLTDLGEEEYRDLIFEFRNSDEYGRGSGGLSDATVNSYENALLLFLKQECDRDWADDIERTSVDTTSVKAEQMLTPADIQALISAATHGRDVALIEFLADTGARISLVASLRTQDVSLDGDRATYTPNRNALGLKGADIKPYPIIDSRAALRNYLRGSHPRPDDPDAALFHKIKPFRKGEDDDGSIRVNAIRQQLYRIADRADVDKPVNPHNFRHSAITRMYREGYSKEQIQHRVQWNIDTAMWDRYVHITAEEMNDTIFAEAGLIDPATDAQQVRKRCGVCNEPVPPHRDFCGTCGEPVDNKARELLDSVLKQLDRQMVEEDDPVERRTALETKRDIEAATERLDTETLHQWLPSDSDA